MNIPIDPIAFMIGILVIALPIGISKLLDLFQDVRFIKEDLKSIEKSRQNQIEKLQEEVRNLKYKKDT